MSLWVVLLVTVFVFVDHGYGEGPVVKENNEGQYQIIDGNCMTAFTSEMVFHDHVHKTKIPLMIRNATSSWHGDGKIYCLKVLNEKDESKGGKAFVKNGGVGHNYVTVEMHSAKSHGLEFTIQVFAK